MNIIARKNLRAFAIRHPETSASLDAWERVADLDQWKSMNDVVSTFSKASPINSERCVFDIAGGNYRLIVSFKFSANTCFIKFIGTHAQYDRIDAATASQF